MKRRLLGIYSFYRDGFKAMAVGRKLWLLIFIKLAIIFLVIKLLFFPDKLATEYTTDEDRAQAVRSSLTAGDIPE